LTKNPGEYIEQKYYPLDTVWSDPSHILDASSIPLLNLWRQHENDGHRPFRFRGSYRNLRRDFREVPKEGMTSDSNVEAEDNNSGEGGQVEENGGNKGRELDYEDEEQQEQEHPPRPRPLPRRHIMRRVESPAYGGQVEENDGNKDGEPDDKDEKQQEQEHPPRPRPPPQRRIVRRVESPAYGESITDTPSPAEPLVCLNACTANQNS
jgi:hypothetical protein